MNKYKVEFLQTEKYVIDVLAENQAEAEMKAGVEWNEAGSHAHYYQIGDTEVEIGTVYDVTNTDDPFNPQ